jgi:hypothetical protein
VFPDIWHWLVAVSGAHDESGAWYGLWSGLGGALPDVMIAAALWAWYWHHTCHVSRCPRFARHPVPGTHWKTCHRHHPLLSGRITAQHIADAHKSAGGT